MKRNVYVVLWDHRFGSEVRVILSDRNDLSLDDVTKRLLALGLEDYEGVGRIANTEDAEDEEPRDDESLELIGPITPTVWESVCNG